MIVNANSLHLPFASGIVQTVVTSPPYYGLRDYGVDHQIGLEKTPEEYIQNLVMVFREVWRVLRDDGTLWVNLGDSYCGYKGDKYNVNLDNSNLQKNNKTPGNHNIGSPHTSGVKNKDLIGIPWMLAFALRQPWLKCHGCGMVSHQSAWGKFPNGRLICPQCEKSAGHEIDLPGWYLRSDIIWSKPNPMPESVTDRPTKAHEYLFLLSKSSKYYYDAEAIKEPAVNGDPAEPRGSRGARTPNAGIRKQDQLGDPRYTGFNDRWDSRNETLTTRNARSVWTIATQPTAEAHFATYPEKLVEPCILAGSKPGDLVLDPFMGSGTTARVAYKLGRIPIGTELNFKYIDEIAHSRTTVQMGMGL